MLSAGSYLDDGAAASGKHHIGNLCQLFIGGLSHSTTEATLRERVSPLGELTAGVPSAAQSALHCAVRRADTAACRPVAH
jgi:hypothetical protein